MKKIVISIVACLFAFSCISVVSAGNLEGKRGKWPAKESPESIVTCLNAGTHLVISRSVHETINIEECKVWDTTVEPDPCAPCITSLEGQGCKMIDVVVEHKVSGPDNSKLEVPVTYLLSCDER